MGKLRIATFNVENLFSRPRVFMFDDSTVGSAVMAKITQLQEMLEQEQYEKSKIVALVNDNQLLSFIDIRCDRVNREGASPSFFRMTNGVPSGVNTDIDGRADWIGAIEFKRQGLPPRSTATMKRVILEDLNADILCLCEIEDRKVLRQFNEEVLEGAYPYEIAIEGNDKRGIDVAVLSRFPIGNLRSNTHLTGDNGAVFDRDCLEATIEISSDVEITLLCNHLKSKGGPFNESKTDPRRIEQARALAKILTERYKKDDGTWRYAVVAGDLNENPDRNGANGAKLEGYKTSISPLLELDGLWGVHKPRPGTAEPDPTPIDGRWTYEFQGNYQQIDHLLLTQPLAEKVVAWGAVRTGRYTDGSNGVAEAIDAASDHGALWVDVELPGIP